MGQQQQKFIWGLEGLKRHHGATVATIGSFDGVHLGHQQILARVVAQAQQEQLASVVIIFEPQPHDFFAKTPVRPRLMRLREKVAALFAAGLDKVVCLRFNPAFRSLSAQAFIEQVLVAGLNVKHLVIGDDFKFGCDRSGDFALLQQLGKTLGFTVANSQTFAQSGERVSSTRIRALLAQNNLALATQLLGKPYCITGRVIYGRQLGRTLGVPTANIGLGRYAAAVSGVYAVQCIFAGQRYNAVANVGVKPTIAGGEQAVLEVHIFDFNQTLYGQYVTVEFCQALRKEQKFASLEALKQQIYCDIGLAKAFFAAH